MAMALVFSNVHMSTHDNQTDFLVTGIVSDYEDLERWTAFQRFIEGISEESTVDVSVDAYLYGEGDGVIATVEEVAYLTARREKDKDFLHRHCTHIVGSGFSFDWCPEELGWGITPDVKM